MWFVHRCSGRTNEGSQVHLSSIDEEIGQIVGLWIRPALRLLEAITRSSDARFASFR